MLREILQKLPSQACLCFVGDGPARADLEQYFAGYPVHFTVLPASCSLTHALLHRSLASLLLPCCCSPASAAQSMVASPQLMFHEVSQSPYDPCCCTAGHAARG